MSKLKKILQVLPSFNPSWGGPKKMVENFVEYIEKEKFADVDIVVTDIVGPSSKVNNSRVNIYELKVTALSKIWKTYSNDFKIFLNKNITNYDLIHIHEMWHYLHYYSAKLATKNKIPYIITPHGGLEKRRLQDYKKKLFLNLVEKKILQNAKYIHALTKYEESDIIYTCPNANTVIVPNGVPEALPPKDKNKVLSNYKIDQNSKKILFLGRLHPEKGVDILLKSFKKKQFNNGEWTLILAGPDESGYKEKYENDKNIIFTGLVDGNEKSSLYKCADVFILPSQGEGFSLSILEAMSYKTPLIISKYCYFPDVVDCNAGLIVNLDENSIFEALEKILKNKKLRDKMAMNGFNLVTKKYNSKRIYSELIKLY